MGPERIDRATRLIGAPPADLYRALMTPADLERWLPPPEMAGHIHAFDPTEGGGYLMSLRYRSDDHGLPGKTSPEEDRVRVIFDALIPGARIEQRVIFESDDPAFAGAMRMSWELRKEAEGTRVTVSCRDVPEGIRPEDHQTGLDASLDGLARFVERRPLPEVSLRPATEADLPAILRIVEAAYSPWVERIGQRPKPMDEDYAALVTRGRAEMAEREGAPVALLVLEWEADHMLLENLAVAPEAQGSGLGTALLAAAEKRAREAGVPEIRLYTHVKMASNIAFYTRHGYEETHRAEEHGRQRVFMTKRL